MTTDGYAQRTAIARAVRYGRHDEADRLRTIYRHGKLAEHIRQVVDSEPPLTPRADRRVACVAPSARGVVVTPAEWDTRWHVIFTDLMGQETGGDQADGFAAALVADRECAEQFGPRPQEATR